MKRKPGCGEDDAGERCVEGERQRQNRRGSVPRRAGVRSMRTCPFMRDGIAVRSGTKRSGKAHAMFHPSNCRAVA